MCSPLAPQLGAAVQREGAEMKRTEKPATRSYFSPKAVVFIAWSKETEKAALILREVLDARGLSVWMSEQITAGRKFREEIRRSVLDAHLMLAIFPEKPSPWQIAESGLAYFENKLIPIAIDSDEVIEPFSEFETHNLRSEDLEAGEGDSIDALEATLRSRIGAQRKDVITLGLVTLLNRIFLLAVPFAGVLAILVIVSLGFLSQSDSGPFQSENVSLHMYRAGHTAFGAMLYGGAAFIALIFALVGAAASYSARRFGFMIAKFLLLLWFLVAGLQFWLGMLLLAKKFNHGYSDEFWLLLSIAFFFMAMISALVAYICHSAAFRENRNQGPMTKIQISVFLGNVCFAVTLVLLTLVILMMSLQCEFDAIFVGRDDCQNRD